MDYVTFRAHETFHCELYACAGDRLSSGEFSSGAFAGVFSPRPLTALSAIRQVRISSRWAPDSAGWILLCSPPVQTATAPGSPALTGTIASYEAWLDSPQSGFAPATNNVRAVNHNDPGFNFNILGTNFYLIPKQYQHRHEWCSGRQLVWDEVRRQFSRAHVGHLFHRL